ncbi:MAG: exodeoxyribonuclease V subunit gamma [Lentisphaeria bacterium]|nr:exodeoxyribonuclease V subunit gamma [Lentisphaeria bacterium]
MENGFYLYTGDSIEKLAAQYVAAREKQPKLFHGNDLFSTEEVIVPSGGMGKWLERSLADQGIMVSNIRFSSLFSFFNRLFPELGTAFSRDVLTWRIVSILKESPPDGLKALHDYICGGREEESCDLRRYSLAAKIAKLFEDYMTESPEMLVGWEDEIIPEETPFHWQAEIWKRLCTGPDGEKTVSPAARIMALLGGDFSAVSGSLSLPVTVWGCSTMPLHQLAVLKKISAKIPVHYFCLNPCDSCWTDDLRKAWSDGREIAEPEAVEALFEGTLLRQWANHEREFFKYLAGVKKLPGEAEKRLAEQQVWQSSEAASKAGVLQRRFSEDGKNAVPGPNGTLQHLQQILRGGSETRPEADDTLTIHCCHNELREVEILRDHLLHLIETRHYSNSDILVAAPDISEFVPCIEAVFRQPIEKGKQTGKSIAYTINGRSVRQNNPLADAFILLLDVGRYRYELDLIEKLLNFQEIRSRFSIEEREIGQLLDECKQAGIRWGIDGNHPGCKFGDFENYSWQHGLDRMLLGLALPDDGKLEGIWNDAVPFDQCDSTDGHDRLRHLFEFLQALRKIEREFAVPCTIEEWGDRLKGLMETFFRRDMERKSYYRGLWNAINEVISGVTRAGHTGDVIPPEVIREAISGHIGVPEEGSSFLNGAISFSNLRDIRGIPCKVLCILGMDNGAYPRAARPDSLDLAEKRRTEECRTVSQQDRYFFLESFLAVRDHLLIYYRGIDDASDKRYYSSTLVSDLRSYAEKIFPELKTPEKKEKEGENGKNGIEIQHSLLPYSHLYYTENTDAPSLRNLWSYNAANRQIDAYVRGSGDWLTSAFAAGGVMNGLPGGNGATEETEPPVPEMLKKQRESFRRTGLFPEKDPEEQRKIPMTIPLKELEDFVQNAGFVFLKNGLNFGRQKKVEDSLPDFEPVNLNSLEKWNVNANRLLPWMFETGKSPDELSMKELGQYYRRLKAENAVPLGQKEEVHLMEYLFSTWIQDDTARDHWKKQNCGKRAKKTLTLDFSGDVPQLPETPLGDLPGLFDDLDHLPGNPCTDVKVVYETTKEDGEPYIYLALAGKSAKHCMRGYLRHLFFNASGDSVETKLIWKEKKASGYPPMEQADARKKLRAILALYLYGQTHAVPFLCECSAKATVSKTGKDGDPPWLGNFQTSDEERSRGDDLLEYATMLWARDKTDLAAQKELCKTLEDLAGKVLAGV